MLRVREQWMTTRTARINALRGILREHGILLPAGARTAVQAVPTVLEDAAAPLPAHLRHVLASVREEVRGIEARVVTLERELRALADADPVVAHLRTIPGIGLLTATALVGTVGQIHTFRRARQFASWLGLTPREHSSGPRRRLGGISKQGTCICAVSSRMAPARCCSPRTAAAAPPGR
jgi:transposase